MRQQLVQKQSLRMTPQQVQVVRLLELPVDELKQRIDQELVDNLSLEVGAPQQDSLTEDYNDPESAEPIGDDYEAAGGDVDSDREEVRDEYASADGNSFFDYDDDNAYNGNEDPDKDSYSPINNYKNNTSFRDDLLAQLDLRDTTEEQKYLAKYIIESLEDTGYLNRNLSDMVDDLAFTQNLETTLPEMEAALELVQDLDPPGIGARDLRECLMLQLESHAGTETARLAYRILDEDFDDFSNKRYAKLMQRMEVSRDQLDAAQKLILSLNPKPAGGASDLDSMETKAAHIVPDFIVDNEDGELVVSINDADIPPIRINQEYQSMFEELKNQRVKTKESREAANMIRDSINSANMFIDALRQRRITLITVMTAIVHMQREFFLTGDRTTLRPMVLREVAEASGYDVSTISRVSNSKFVQTCFGTFLVKALFTDAAQKEDGDIVSNEAIRHFLQQCIDEEDKHSPLTDERLTEMLAEKGFKVARRTVAKYREQLGINTARLRREV